MLQKRNLVVSMALALAICSSQTQCVESLTFKMYSAWPGPVDNGNGGMSEEQAINAAINELIIKLRQQCLDTQYNVDSMRTVLASMNYDVNNAYSSIAKYYDCDILELDGQGQAAGAKHGQDLMLQNQICEMNDMRAEGNGVNAQAQPDIQTVPSRTAPNPQPATSTLRSSLSASSGGFNSNMSASEEHFIKEVLSAAGFWIIFFLVLGVGCLCLGWWYFDNKFANSSSAPRTSTVGSNTTD